MEWGWYNPINNIQFHIQDSIIPWKDEEDPCRFGLDASAHQIPYAFSIADQYLVDQSACLSLKGQSLQLPKENVYNLNSFAYKKKGLKLLKGEWKGLFVYLYTHTDMCTYIKKHQAAAEVLLYNLFRS